MAADLNTPSLPRRAILAGGAAGLLPALPVEATPKPDTELLRLGQAFEAAWAFEDGLWKAMPDDDSPEHEAQEIAACAAFERTKGLVLHIRDVPASTIQGMRVKARAALWMNNGEPFDPGDIEYDFAQPMAASIMTDLLNLGA
jgi:hypothetical protein